MFYVPPLPYEKNALEPYLSAQVIEFHYEKHHHTYCSNLNKILENQPIYLNTPIEQLLKIVETLPIEIKQGVINNGGGLYNHNLYWESMKPHAKPAPEGTLMEEIKKSFVTFEDFQKLFTESALKLFGSGWTWLVQTRNGDLKIINTANQDSPISMGYKPILGIDVWEHAYYLQYQNRRADYIANWWKIINWDVVSKRLETPLA